MDWKALVFSIGFVMIFAIRALIPVQEPKISCDETITVLKQTIDVKNITNQTLKEMIRKRDSIIYVQDSTIVALKIK